MDKELEKIYDEIVNNLHTKEDTKYHVLETIEGKKFKLIRSSLNNIVVIPFTDISTPMTISKYEVGLFLDKGKGNYDSYTKMILPYLRGEKNMHDIPVVENNAYVHVNHKEELISNCKVKNIILYGAPGVGKTHNYQNLISMIEESKSQNEIFDIISKNNKVSLDNDIFETIKKEKRVEFVTFHQSYSYEDFIEGFRPNESGDIELRDGIFKRLCAEALMQKNKNFYIVIDEINRGNISKIFGELITLIEEDKRDIYEVTLPYSKEKFKVPSNLYIIATMNLTDKSIATIDIALRRRFTFLKMKPNESLILHVRAKELFNTLNSFIKEKLSEDYMLGHSYFMNINDDEDLEFVKEYKIRPLLEEYFYADDENFKKAEEMLTNSKGKTNE